MATTRSSTTPPPRVRDDRNVESVPWVAEGVAAGALGAAVVALFFFVVDLAAGHALWTPYVLGTALVLGRVPSPDASIDAVLVLGYTALHGAVFLAIGLIAAFELMTGGRLPGATPLRRAIVLAVLLFAAFEVVFVAYGTLMEPALVGMLGFGRVTIANALAAAAMAGLLQIRLLRRGRDLPEAG